ncbi:MAG: hypothetical protein KDJ52_27020 [Anaerolineae bacterium]|nr:hypothetical protein [Anaerolineae bacterium]
MDLNLIITTGNLLSTMLEKNRPIWKEQAPPHYRQVGLNLLETLFTVDTILEIHEKTITLLSQLPGAGEELCRIAVLGKKWKLLDCIHKQQTHVDALIEPLRLPLNIVGAMTDSLDNHFIEPSIPDDMRLAEKDIIMAESAKVSKWQTVKTALPMAWAGVSVQRGLEDYQNAIRLTTPENTFKIQLPAQMQVRILASTLHPSVSGQIAGYERVAYDITTPAGLSAFLEQLNHQQELALAGRDKLAQSIEETFTLDALLQAK